MSGLRIEPARECDHRLRERRDRSRCFRVGGHLGDGRALVGSLAHDRIERDPGEKRHAHLVRERLAAARAEELLAGADEVRHVLDDAEHAHARLLRHLRGAHGNLLRCGLRRRHDERLRAWQ